MCVFVFVLERESERERERDEKKCERVCVIEIECVFLCLY